MIQAEFDACTRKKHGPRDSLHLMQLFLDRFTKVASEMLGAGRCLWGEGQIVSRREHIRYV